MEIYNSLTQKKMPFTPIRPNHVGLYVCGMTVYDYCHIGHGRVLAVFDTVARYLRYRGYELTYVRNITDIDDKIIQRAQANGESVSSLTQRFIQAMHEDEQALNILPPDREPRATEFIPQMIHMVQQLYDRGYAYVGRNGDVYFRVAKFPAYGQLAHRDLEGLQAGARVEVVDAKADPLDFVLWKTAKADEPHWHSPWGPGRPGWHIECSAMSTHCLGNHFDLHGGGFDLLFPHHENEVAQSVGATGEPFVSTWMHVGFIQVNKEKMSKSLGNFFTIREILTKYPPEVLRYFLIASHYRSQINYTEEALVSAQGGLERLQGALTHLPPAEPLTDSVYETRFNAAMDDDFNTPMALAVLFDLAADLNRHKNAGDSQAANLGALLKKLGNILGILQKTQNISASEQEKIQKLIDERNQARAQKNWQRADALRQELTELGVTLEDTKEGTLWHR